MYQLNSRNRIQNNETPPATAVSLFQMLETFVPSKP
jgi:hypothetical protein